MRVPITHNEDGTASIEIDLCGARISQYVLDQIQAAIQNAHTQGARGVHFTIRHIDPNNFPRLYSEDIVTHVVTDESKS
jgi:hypothetical protein